MIEKTGPTIYKGDSIYKTGAGGGGGGGGGNLPEGFKKCQYIEVINVGNIIFDNSFNDLSVDDYIEISAFVNPGSTAWSNSITFIGYNFGGPSRTLSFKQNGSQSVVNGFLNQVSLNAAPSIILIKKQGSFLSLNSASINNDTYSGTVTKMHTTFFEVAGAVFKQSKLFYLNIYSNDKTVLKHSFIACKDDLNRDAIIDTITQQYVLLDTSKFIAGPNVE